MIFMWGLLESVGAKHWRYDYLLLLKGNQAGSDCKPESVFRNGKNSGRVRPKKVEGNTRSYKLRNVLPSSGGDLRKRLGVSIPLPVSNIDDIRSLKLSEAGTEHPIITGLSERLPHFLPTAPASKTTYTRNQYM
jgi:hypothetical protein